MNEQDDIPRLDGLRPDDPPFRSYFGTQPDKSPEQLWAQRQEHKPVSGYQSIPEFTEAQLTPKPEDKPIPKATETIMHDQDDIVAKIKELAGHDKYIRVDKLLEALK